MQLWVCLLYNLYNTHEFILRMTWCHVKNELAGLYRLYSKHTHDCSLRMTESYPCEVAEWAPFGRELLTQLIVSVICITCISHFGLEGRIFVLVASNPDNCLDVYFCICFIRFSVLYPNWNEFHFLGMDGVLTKKGKYASWYRDA